MESPDPRAVGRLTAACASLSLQPVALPALRAGKHSGCRDSQELGKSALSLGS